MIFNLLRQCFIHGIFWTRLPCSITV